MLRPTTLWVGLFVASVAWRCNAQDGWPDLSNPPESEGIGAADAALIIGIEDYVFVEDVDGAVANANDWYSYLKTTRGLPLGSAVVLRDHEATRESILREARDAASRVQDGGTLWVVFIGHGAPAKDGRDGLILGADVQQSAESVYARGVSRGELMETLATGAQERNILVLDTCFSGRGSDGGALVDGLQPLIPDYANQAPDALVLTAGRGDQFAGPLPGASRPAFSYLLLGALHGWGDLDGSGEVTAQEAVDYAHGALVELARDRRQSPQILGGGGGAVLSHGRAAGPDLTAMVLGASSSTTPAASDQEHPAAAPVETVPAVAEPSPTPILDDFERSEPGRFKIAVPAELAEWTRTGVYLEQGQMIAFSVTGAAYCGRGYENARGWSDQVSTGEGQSLDGFNHCALVARVGDTQFPTSLGLEGAAPGTGELLFMVNDNRHEGNKGSFTVKLRVLE